MSDNVENIVLEHLRHIRSRVDQIADDTSDLKHRMSSLESAMMLVEHEVIEVINDDETVSDTDAPQQVT